MKTQSIETLEKLPPTKTSSGPQSLMVTIGGTLVQEYDKLLNSYNQDLLDLNGSKTSLREDRDKLRQILNQGQKILKTPEGGPEEKGTNIYLTSSQKTELEKILKNYGYPMPRSENGLYFFSDKTLTDLQEKIDGQIQDLNSSSEIKMIHFQALMDARKQAMMMLSNLLNADKTTKESIIQNMRG